MNCHFVIAILTNFTNCVVSNPAFMLQYEINGWLVDWLICTYPDNLVKIGFDRQAT